MEQLSIIIPHYNTPKLLMRLLDTIPNLSEIEVLVIDDSSDKDLDIYKYCMEKYGERNIKFYTNPLKTKGAGNARNVGLKCAIGKWLLFADADDYFIDGFWNIIQGYLEEEADIIFFETTSIILRTGEISDRHEYYTNLVEEYCQKNDHKEEILLRYQYWSPCAKLIRRELINLYQIQYEGTLYSNDILFSAKAGYYAKSIKAVRKVIYCITQSEKSLTSKKDSNALSIRKKAFCNYYFFLLFHISRGDMHELGFGIKDFIYYCLYKTGLIR